VNPTDTRPYRFTLADVSAAIVPFCIALGAALLLAEPTDDVTLSRTVYTIWATIVLVTPALVAFILPSDSEHIRATWILFWTLSFIVYVVHMGYALFGVYGGSGEAFMRGQGAFPAVINVIFTAWWALDVGLAWLYRPTVSPRWLTGERVGAHVFVALTFVVSTLVLKHGVVNVIGAAMTACIIVALLSRIDSWRTSRAAEASP
jgi:hypothetical protein